MNTRHLELSSTFTDSNTLNSFRSIDNSAFCAPNDLRDESSISADDILSLTSSSRELLKRKHVPSQSEEKSKRQTGRGHFQTCLSGRDQRTPVPQQSITTTTASSTNYVGTVADQHLYSHPTINSFPYLYSGQAFPTSSPMCPSYSSSPFQYSISNSLPPREISSSLSPSPATLPSPLLPTAPHHSSLYESQGHHATSQPTFVADNHQRPLNRTSFLPSLANLNLLPPSYSTATSATYPARSLPVPHSMFSSTCHTNNNPVNININTPVVNNSGPQLINTNNVTHSTGRSSSSQQNQNTHNNTINSPNFSLHSNSVVCTCSRVGSSCGYHLVHSQPSSYGPPQSFAPSSDPPASSSHLNRHPNEIPTAVHPQVPHRFIGTSGPYRFPALQGHQSWAPNQPLPQPLRNTMFNAQSTTHDRYLSSASPGGFSFGHYHPQTTTTSTMSMPSFNQPISRQEPHFHFPSHEDYLFSSHRRRCPAHLFGASHFAANPRKLKEEDENEEEEEDDYEEEEEEEEEEEDEEPDEEYTFQGGLFHRDSVLDFSRGLSFRHSYNRYQQYAPMLFRELTENDYDFLLQLDDGLPNKSGALPHKIQSLPTLVSTGEEELQCCICLSEVEKDEVVKELGCKHRFHAHCIDKWLAINSCCPIDKLAVTFESKT